MAEEFGLSNGIRDVHGGEITRKLIASIYSMESIDKFFDIGLFLYIAMDFKQLAFTI